MSTVFALVSPQEWAVLARLFVAVVLGAAVGFERERSGKVAGLRTHAMVSLGAALFTVTSMKLYADYPSVNGVSGLDYHIIANIIVGIGFIGAGAILRLEDRIVGTTTAASLWVVAAIGIASGLGYFREALATALLAYLVLAMLWSFEKRLRRPANGNGSPRV